MSGPSEHLSWKELACKDGTPYPSNYIADGTAARLATVFENIRDLYDKPIEVFSAFRTESWNNKIGGAKFSMHKVGRALDLRPPSGISLNKFYTDIKMNAKLFGIHGIGKYKTFVHVDIRPINGIVFWTGTGVKDSGDK